MSADDPIPAILRLQYLFRDRLPMWIVFDHPAEFPDYYIAKMVLTLPGVEETGAMLMSDRIEPLREQLQALGLTRTERHPSDQWNILETWL